MELQNLEPKSTHIYLEVIPIIANVIGLPVYNLDRIVQLEPLRQKGIKGNKDSPTQRLPTSETPLPPLCPPCIFPVLTMLQGGCLQACASAA